MNIYELYKISKREELDYSYLLGVLAHYKQPRLKISQWLAKNELLRVKKGIYVFNPKITGNSYSRELLANWIYGPSAISLHYALSYYSLIPEKVVVLTSITFKKNKSFNTSVGLFSYTYQKLEKFQIGLTIVEHESKNKFIMVSPEKAIFDLLTLSTAKLANEHAFQVYLEEDMRFDLEALQELNIENFKYLYSLYKHPNINFMLKWLRRCKH